jgi:DNA-binding CsgD family transcriptional regulator
MSDLSGRNQERLLETLQELLALEATDLKPALEHAAQQIADVLIADKVDVFLHEPDSDMLVALGTNESPMARLQQARGLDRLPVSGGGWASLVYQTGQSRFSNQLDQDPEELRAIVEELGVRSQHAVPLDVRGERHGVLMACSARPGYFTEDDRRFLESVARWVGLVGYRVAVVEQAVINAARESLRLAAEDTVGKLTPRQREVATLIANGLTNMEIAERLVLTPGTVANHIEHILRRLGYRSRSQVAALMGHRNASAGDQAERRQA